MGEVASLRVRRLQGLDARVAKALVLVDARRTRQWLEHMAEPREDIPTSTRLPEDLVAELDALAQRIELDPQTEALIGPRRGMSRAAVLRLALYEGVKVLNKKHPKRKRRAG